MWHLFYQHVSERALLKKECFFRSGGAIRFELRSARLWRSRIKYCHSGLIHKFRLAVTTEYSSSPRRARFRKRNAQPRSEIDKLACQAQSEGIFAYGEYLGGKIRFRIFIQADEGSLVCNQRARPLNVIATKSRMASRGSVYLLSLLLLFIPLRLVGFARQIIYTRVIKS